MRGVIEITDLSAIRSAWERVFHSNDPFSWPFQPEFAAGRIFFPTDGYHLTKQQFLAFADALMQAGENELFISVVESEGLSFLERSWGHWACASLSYEDYVQLPLTLENAIYSREGRWGILISHEMHALIGGSAGFMAALDDQYRRWSDDLRLLREAWAENPNASWLEPTISHAIPV
ncbi:MAG: hypothetical protein HC897_06200 [Thermoanaerobaculia bacterium]|nr:hypothetical protein [Thermoanaerobaculia bacterium]